MKNILRLLAAALLLGCGVTARAHTEPAHTIELKPRMCHAVVEAGELPAPQVRQLPYACSGRPQGFHDDWLWLRADGGELQSLPADWRLLVDQTRFASMRAIVVRADGSMDEHRFRSGQAQGNWAVGGFLRFDIDSGSAPVTEVHLGIERLVNLDTMRKIRAVAEAEFIETQILWVALASVFAGVVGASLAYTSFLYTGLRHAFLRQYAFWCLAVLAYGLSWSGLALYVAPELAGSWGVRLNLWTAGLATLFAALFMVEFLERHALPRRLRRLLVGTGWASLAAAVLASFDHFGPTYAFVLDRTLNVIVAVGVALVILGILVAHRRGSRAVRFYALAWSPALAAFVLRMLRNFHVVPHADWIDMGLFAATIIEAMLLSAAISDRFRKLEAERNSARAERAVLSRLAETDDITGLYNRRGFVARVEGLVAARPAAMGLIVIDIDHFKSVNDRFGHDTGDRVLAAIGAVLGRCSGPGLCAGRLGGEEFGIAAALTCTELVSLGDGLRREIGRLDPGGNFRVSVSAGVAGALGPTTFVELYRRADEALYAAKAQGRDRVIAADDEVARRAA